MKEARCEPASGGVVPRGTYIAGRTFGQFARATEDIYIKSFSTNGTNTEHERSDADPRPRSKKRHPPHHDDRKFLMLIDNNGCETFKACSPTCVDVVWADVPVRKRIEGFGRKGKDQNKFPEGFIPQDLMQHQVLYKRRELNTTWRPELTSPNATFPHTPWTKDSVSYVAVMDTPFEIDFEKCVSHVQRKGNSWVEVEQCHRIGWDQIPVGEFIAGFGQKKDDGKPEDATATSSAKQARDAPSDRFQDSLEPHLAPDRQWRSKTAIYRTIQFNIDRRTDNLQYDFSAGRIVSFLFEEESRGPPRTYTAFKNPRARGILFMKCTYGQPWYRLGDPDYSGDDATNTCSPIRDRFLMYWTLGYLISFFPVSYLEQAAQMVLILRTGGFAMICAMIVIFGMLLVGWAVWWVLHQLGIVRIRSLLGFRIDDDEEAMR
ncbi:hypothetical protein PRZ48_011909 [Zasmidium cellare]|uniref:Transmembrane protein n=1 Tax=Zasmidium cellare TaxID=395010 RepID=A0ABR0E8Q0_ZASCE|nr:hypothetical protein PRZ48_011909 [Zasmidium cellare]